MVLHLRTLGAIITALIASAVSSASPFGCIGNETFSQQIAQAAGVFAATPTSSAHDPKAKNEETTVLKIETVIKPHAIIAGRTSVTINRYIQIERTNPRKFIVFCDVTNGQIDAYFGFPCEPNSKLPEYLAGAWKVHDQNVQSRLAFFFKYLDSSEKKLSGDAHQEFANVSYKDLSVFAKKLDPQTLTQWLKDKNTNEGWIGIYASMLGECGKLSDAQLLRSMLDESNPRFILGAERMLTAYLRLQPKEAWTYVRGVIGDSKRDFIIRYAALRAAQFIIEFRPDLVSKEDVVSGISIMLAQEDIADLVIEDLRNWKCWDMTDKVLSLANLKTHDVPIIRSRILRFALSTAAIHPKSAAFVAAERKRDAEWVKDVEEGLELEREKEAAKQAKPGK